MRLQKPWLGTLVGGMLLLRAIGAGQWVHNANRAGVMWRARYTPSGQLPALLCGLPLDVVLGLSAIDGEGVGGVDQEGWQLGEGGQPGAVV